MSVINILFSFEGRINRRPLWGFWLVASAINLVVFVMAYKLIATGHPSAQITPEDFEKHLESLSWFNYVSLALLWPSLALGVKRAHDRNRSGWFLLLLFVPLINFWPLIELACIAGTPGANRFGPDPLPSAKPGLGWLILLGHLILIAVQASYTVSFITFFMERGSDIPLIQKSTPPSDNPPQAAPTLRPSAI